MSDKMTPLDSQLDDVRQDQFVVNQVLDGFDFDLAAKLVAIVVEQKALEAEKSPSKGVYRLAANRVPIGLSPR